MKTDKIASFGAYGLHIIQFPSGKFGYVGTVPVILLKECKNNLGLPYHSSLTFETFEAANQYFEDNKHLINNN